MQQLLQWGCMEFQLEGVTYIMCMFGGGMTPSGPPPPPPPPQTQVMLQQRELSLFSGGHI